MAAESGNGVRPRSLSLGYPVPNEGGELSEQTHLLASSEKINSTFCKTAENTQDRQPSPPIPSRKLKKKSSTEFPNNSRITKNSSSSENNISLSQAVDTRNSRSESALTPGKPDTNVELRKRSKSQSSNVMKGSSSLQFLPRLVSENSPDRRKSYLLPQQVKFSSIHEKAVFNILSEISGDEAKEFDEKLWNELQMYLRKEKKLSPVNLEIIYDKMRYFFRREIEELVKSQGDMSYGVFVNVENPRAMALLSMIIHSGVMLIPIVKRLRAIQKNIFDFSAKENQRSKKFTEIYNDLDQLMTEKTREIPAIGNVSGVNLTDFMATLNAFKKDKSKTVTNQIIKDCIVDKPLNRSQKTLFPFRASAPEEKEVMAFLSRWAKPTTSELKELEVVVENNSKEAVRINNLTLPENLHEWFEEDECQYPITHIVKSAVVRDFMSESKVEMSRITINGEELDLGKYTEKAQQKQFFCDLFKKIYEKGFEKERLNGKDLDEVINDEVDRLLYEDPQIKKADDPKKTELEALKNNPIPCLKILRLCTITSWKGADEFIKKLYPRLYTYPYVLSKMPEPRVECHITIEGSSDFYVTLQRKYGVYARAYSGEDPHLTRDTDKVYMIIPFSWEIRVLEDVNRCFAKLRIPEVPEVLYKDGKQVATHQEKWEIFDSLVYCKEEKNLELYNLPNLELVSKSKQSSKKSRKKGKLSLSDMKIG